MRISAPISALLTLSLALCAACGADAPPAPQAIEAETAKVAEAPPAKVEAPKEKVALAQTRFGQPLAAGETTSLASIVADPAKFAGTSVKTEGVVKAVCKSAGCWMEIEDASGRAHVKMAGHSFYVPKNCDGHRAVIQGTVAAGAPADTCASKDSCGGSAHGALAKLEIEATGVEFID